MSKALLKLFHMFFWFQHLMAFCSSYICLKWGIMHYQLPFCGFGVKEASGIAASIALLVLVISKMLVVCQFQLVSCLNMLLLVGVSLARCLALSI